MKVSSTFSKAAGCRGGAPARAPQSAESSCAHKSAGGGPRGNPRRGFPLLFFAWCGCAVLLGGGLYPVLPFDPISFVLPKETVSSRQRKALFLPWRLHHSRERYCLGYLYSSSPDLGRGWCWSGAWCGCADTLGGGDGLSCNSTPFHWCLPKETVSSRQRKAPFYPGGSTIRVSAPASVDGGHLRPTWGGAGGHLSGCLRRGRTGFVMAALRGQSTARASLSLSGSAHLQKRVSLGLHPVSLRKSKEMGWNWQ